MRFCRLGELPAFCHRRAAKGGKVVVTGLIGGAYSTAVVMFALKAMTIEGTTTGTLAEARQLIDLVRAKRIPPPPITERQLGHASQALDDLHTGPDRRTRRRHHLELGLKATHKIRKTGLAFTLNPFGGENSRNVGKSLI